MLKLRIQNHRTIKTSHIFLHIQQCSSYKHNLQETYGNRPSEGQKRENFQSLFPIIERDLQNIYARNTFEGLMITLDKPELNKQVYHRKTALICNCL